ncbi:MAG: DEAD/DEAH box helicase [Actinomycetota bacterium]|nr:DEAD/DEAH box helicase [Actinomycetota bacterium]MDQ3647782.1 DEAD/DEAH box helicase [Actinomycetota bacterium]
MSEGERTEAAPAAGRVWLLAQDPHERELVFGFGFDEELNAAVRELPRRWFDWRRKHWRVPADPRIAKQVEELLARFGELAPAPEVLAWLSDSDRWRALVSVVVYEGGGAFALRTLSGEAPADLEGVIEITEGRLVWPFSAVVASRLVQLEGVQLDDVAAACVRTLRSGGSPAPAELSLEIGEDGEPEVTLSTVWDPAPARDFRRLPEAHLTERGGRFYSRSASTGVAVPADPSLARDLAGFLELRPDVGIDDSLRAVLDELVSEHDRASATVALSYADDAELSELPLGGELHPFQRAGVQYALERRRTFIADEQGLGKTIQALAAIEAAGAFPAVVVCPASVKLNWERETQRWLPQRSVAVIDGRNGAGWPPEAESAELVILNYDILEAHLEKLSARGLRALVLDESHYVKNARAQRTKATIELASKLPDDALRLALTGTPVLNRPEELVSQLRALGRLGEFGSGARLSRRFRDAGSDDRLHWNLRAHCYVRRTKQQVLPQLPSKRHDTVPLPLSNEDEYRLAEQDVIAWLQTLPLDLRTLDAKVAAALRSEQLVRLNNLRQLAARGKLATALSWISDFLVSGEPLVVFAEHVAMQRAVLDHFPGSVHILGADSTRKRQRAVDAFQAENGPQLIVCSLKAASQGLTLTRASNVAFLELDWTPARHDQAEDRLHRIGQESAVTAWYLLAPNTIDEAMGEVLDRKRAVIDAVTDGQVRSDESIVDAVVRDLRERPAGDLRVVA